MRKSASTKEQCLPKYVCRGSQLELELGSHHGSQEGSAAVSSHEGDEIDKDEAAAAAADFTPMTEEKRIFVNEWIAKLGNDLPDDENQMQVYCTSAVLVSYADPYTASTACMQVL